MNREKIVEKIKALLNKTVDNGCSEAEMGAALDKARACNCQVWQKRRRDTKVVEFCGLQSDVRLASWLLDTLAQFVQAEIVRHLMETLPPKSEKRRVIRGFVRGCTDRIGARLDALRDRSVAAATSNGRELVLVKNAAIDAKMKACGIKLTGYCLGGQTNDAGYRAGLSAGDRASFGRPVSGHNATLRLK